MKSFLAGFMIAFRPTHVFGGAQEEELLKAARSMLKLFEEICGFIALGSFQDVPPSLSKDFPAVLLDYLKALKAWRQPHDGIEQRAHELLLEHLAAEGVDYERCKFQDKLRAGTLTLERVRAWVRNSLRTSAVGEAQAVHSSGIVDLVCGPTALNRTTCPETLLLDVRRLARLQQDLKHITTAAAMMVTATHGITATRLPSDLCVLSSICHLLAEQPNSGIEDKLMGSSLTPTQRNALLSAITLCASPADKVHQLM